MMDEKNTVFVAIDYQERLVPVMNENERLVSSSVQILEGLNMIGVPGLATTQYAKGLGDIVPEIKNALYDTPVYDKNTFSVMRNAEFKEALKELADGKDVIAIGMETHICLEQSVLDMIDEGYRVYVPADCVSSRRSFDTEVALKRLADAGCIITSGEAILFELIKGAKHPAFKDISKLVK